MCPDDTTAAAREYARFLEALVVLQQYSYDRIVVPQSARVTEEEGKELMRVEALLRGATAAGGFDRFVVQDLDLFADWDDAERSLIQESPQILSIDAFGWRTVMVERIEFESVRVVRTGDTTLLRPGTSDPMHAVAVKMQ